MDKLRHPSVITSALAGVGLAAVSLNGGIWWWLWVIWGVLSVVAVRQALRD